MKNRELHLHLDGSLRIETVKELLKEEKIDNFTFDELKQRMEVQSNCQSLVEYLKRFKYPLKVLQTPESIERVSYELAEDLSKLNMDYSEIRFAPQLSTTMGFSQKQITLAAIKGLERAEKDFGIKCGLILCMMRNKDNFENNEETLKVAYQTLGNTVCAIDLAGAESLFPTKLFEPLFIKAKDLNLPMTIHAGEVDDKESLEDAIRYGTKRIGHGILAAKYPTIISKLIDNDITLEVCITSNFQTKAMNMKNLDEHPVKYLFEQGVRIALSSDNSTVSNTNIANEFEIAKNILNFDEQDLNKIREYTKEASFLK